MGYKKNGFLYLYCISLVETFYNSKFISSPEPKAHR